MSQLTASCSGSTEAKTKSRNIFTRGLTAIRLSTLKMEKQFGAKAPIPKLDVIHPKL